MIILEDAVLPSRVTLCGEVVSVIWPALVNGVDEKIETPRLVL